MAVNAANEYPSDHASKYTPVVYSSKVMKIFTESTVANEICNNDYSGDIKGKGDTVNIRVAPTGWTVGDYTAGTGVTWATPTENARVLLIDQAKYVAFEIEEVSEVQSDISLIDVFADRAGVYLAIDTDTNVLAVAGNPANIHADNVGAAAGHISGSYDLGVADIPVQVTTSNAVQKIVDLGTVLDEFNVPSENRYIVLPAWYSNFIKKGDLKQADITGDATGVIRTGLIGQIDRFKVYQSNLLPHEEEAAIGAEAAFTVETFSVIAGVKDAMTFASQVTKTTIAEAEDTFSTKWKTLLVYGRKVIMPEAISVLRCTADAYTRA